MPDKELPHFKRTLPWWGVGLFTLFFYGFAIPLNWLMSRRGAPMMLRPNKRQQEMLDKVAHAFDGYTPTEHDIFVNTFSKSGTNWMMQICHQAAFRGEGEYANIHDVVAWPDMHVQLNGRYILGLDDPRVQQASPTGRRVIKSHLAASCIPYNEQAKYITVIRDPKEVFVSSCHFIAGIYGGLTPPVDAMLDAFLGDNFPLSFATDWAEHTAGYWAWREKPNVLVLSFRAMKQDLHATVTQVVDFLGIDLTPAQLAAVEEQSSFAYMKNIDDRFFPIDQHAFPWMGVSMVRVGREGNSKELITTAQQKRIDTHFMQALQAMGSDFPYAEFCRVTD